METITITPEQKERLLYLLGQIQTLHDDSEKEAKKGIYRLLTHDGDNIYPFAFGYATGKARVFAEQIQKILGI